MSGETSRAVLQYARGKRNSQMGLISGDFSDETLFAAATAQSQFLIDRTTTMRVPRGWYIGVLVQNVDTNTSAPRGIYDTTFLHYKVLS